jgi:hypothetical protein
MKCRDSWVKEHLAGFASGGLKQEAAGRVAPPKDHGRGENLQGAYHK